MAPRRNTDIDNEPPERVGQAALIEGQTRDLYLDFLIFFGEELFALKPLSVKGNNENVGDEADVRGAQR